jgi:hypothetical protein
VKLVIVEVRTYTIVAGLRQRFLRLFETRTRPLQLSLGIQVFGPWLDIENPDRFVWLRAFPSLEERERMKRVLYEGAEWTGELEAVMMPMLAEFTSILIEMDGDALAGLARGANEVRGTS